MRKLMVLAAMLAMMLVAASPAFAQATAIDDSSDVTFEDSFNVFAPQVAFVAGVQTNSGDANAAAIDNSVAASAVEQSFELEVEQFNGGF
ncbi:MAG: hypothetical protein H0U02_07060 [Rubrobacter sp.]|nr:hypothetical protein [Rubrobacter sp.]MBA3791505.1 hypothetical protein [Rubrobacter sp.]